MILNNRGSGLITLGLGLGACLVLPQHGLLLRDEFILAR